MYYYSDTFFCGQYCKCASKATLNATDDAVCDMPCPGRLIERYGSIDSVSLYDTLRMLRKINLYGAP